MATQSTTGKHQLTINWHILEMCNYTCKYCYAIYDGNNPRGELRHRPEDWKKVLEDMRHIPDYIGGDWSGIRLNIAGGEPMLLWRKGKGQLGPVLDHAKSLGFSLSIISNGSLIDETFIEAWGPHLQILGVSMDSADRTANFMIGRCGRGEKGGWTRADEIARLFAAFRDVNPEIECKLNTVVNAYNHEEDLHRAISRIGPDRWKVFQMLPVADNERERKRQAPLLIDRATFKSFVARHEDIDIMRPEDNDDMTESYIMIDPMGRLYQNDGNGNAQKHVFSPPIHEVGFEKALSAIRFDKEKFCARYEQNGERHEPPRRATRKTA